jgi:hypothetical protein
MSVFNFDNSKREKRKGSIILVKSRKFFVVLLIYLLTCLPLGMTADAAVSSLTNGTQFKDTSGNVIHAHVEA